MRALLLGALGLAAAAAYACTPDIAYESYLCGENQLCPSGQTCDGATAHCESPVVAAAFACATADEIHEPDDTPATAQAITGLTCPSNLLSLDGCVAPTDADGDWYTIAVPATCGAVVVHLHISYPQAWQELPFDFGDDTGAVLEQSGDCSADEVNSLKGAGLVDKCLKRTLDAGKTYTIHVYKGDPGTSCDGACSFNRYTLTAQLLSS
jgi:hypothetical protein